MYRVEILRGLFNSCNHVAFHKECFTLYSLRKYFQIRYKAYVSEEILNWHSRSLSADICIHFYCLSWLRQASQRKMIQSSFLRLRLSQFKISPDAPAYRHETEKKERILDIWRQTLKWIYFKFCKLSKKKK
jgi:hypothetical protein